MPFIEVTEENLEREHVCCAIGNDFANRARAQTKKDWMKNEFANGLAFRKLDERGKVFIEYMPVETAWKPIVGANYFAINCLWVSGQFKGKGFGKKLLESYIEDAKENGSPFGTLGIYYNGKFITHELMTEKKFRTLLGTIAR